MKKIYTIQITDAFDQSVWYKMHQGRQLDCTLSVAPNESWKVEALFKTVLPVAILPPQQENQRELVVQGFVHPLDCKILSERIERVAPSVLN